MKPHEIPAETFAATLDDAQLERLESVLTTSDVTGPADALRIELQLEQIRRGGRKTKPKAHDPDAENRLKVHLAIPTIAASVWRAMGVGVPSRGRGKRFEGEAFKAGIDYGLGLTSQLEIADPTPEALRAAAAGIEAVGKAKAKATFATRRVIAAGIEAIRLARKTGALPTWADVKARLEADDPKLFEPASDGDWTHTRQKAGLEILPDGEPNEGPAVRRSQGPREAAIVRRAVGELRAELGREPTTAEVRHELQALGEIPDSADLEHLLAEAVAQR